MRIRSTLLTAMLAALLATPAYAQDDAEPAEPEVIELDGAAAQAEEDADEDAPADGEDSEESEQTDKEEEGETADGADGEGAETTDGAATTDADGEAQAELPDAPRDPYLEPAEPTEAERLAAQAEDAFGESDYRRAIELLQQAYDTDQNPNMLYNIARVYEEIGELD